MGEKIILVIISTKKYLIFLFAKYENFTLLNIIPVMIFFFFLEIIPVMILSANINERKVPQQRFISDAPYQMNIRARVRSWSPNFSQARYVMVTTYKCSFIPAI